MSDREKKKKHANAVFEGGGVKGIGIAGALSVAGQLYEWDYVAGTSAGAIIAALVAAGYTSDEIKDMVFSIDYKRFEDSDLLTNMPILGPLIKLKFELGIYKGDYIEKWIKEKLKEKGIEKFGDLVVAKESSNNQGRYRLQVIASDITTGKLLILPQDIVNYGIHPDYLEVARAIRMSISIPFFFRPVSLKYTGADAEQHLSYIVDGAVLSNFPVWIFDTDTGRDSVPTFGFKLIGPEQGRPNEINGPFSMLKALFNTMMDAHDNRFIEEKNFDRTIAIPTMGIGTADFGVSRKKMTELYFSGVSAAENFFNGWDYQRYLIKHTK